MNYVVRAALIALGIALTFVVAVVLSSTIKPSIYYAVRNGNTNAVQKYVSGGGDINRRIIIGKQFAPSLLGIAIREGQVNTVELLLKNKADPNFIAAGLDGAPLVLVVDSCGSGESVDRCPQIMKLLLAYGANPNLTDQWGNHCPALYNAAAYGNTELIKLLLAAGAEVNATNSFGQTPLHTVRDVESARLLIVAGANCKALANNETPADVALREKRLKVYEYLSDECKR